MSVRRQGSLIIVPRALLALPGFCVKCGEPATTNLQKTFYWHSPVFYALLVIPILYAIIAAPFRRSMRLGVPLCRAHVKRRRILFASGVLLLLVAIPAGWLIGRDPGVFTGLGLFLLGLVLLVQGAGTLRPVKITSDEATFTGCCKAYLDRIAGDRRK